MPELLRDVYCSHRQGLFSLALSITGSRQQAEDAVQEAFANMAGRAPPARDPVPYVFKAVRHAAIDIRRKQRRAQHLSVSLFNGYCPPAEQSDPQLHLLSKERDQILRIAINNLPEHEREAIVLRALAGLTFDQAGKTTGVPAKTIATQYRRALQKLETRLRGKL